MNEENEVIKCPWCGIAKGETTPECVNNNRWGRSRSCIEVKQQFKKKCRTSDKTVNVTRYECINYRGHGWEGDDADKRKFVHTFDYPMNFEQKCFKYSKVHVMSFDTFKEKYANYILELDNPRVEPYTLDIIAAIAALPHSRIYAYIEDRCPSLLDYGVFRCTRDDDVRLLKILLCSMNGYSQPIIGKLLGINPATVSKKLKKIYRDMGIKKSNNVKNAKEEDKIKEKFVINRQIRYYAQTDIVKIYEYYSNQNLNKLDGTDLADRRLGKIAFTYIVTKDGTQEHHLASPIQLYSPRGESGPDLVVSDLQFSF